MGHDSRALLTGLSPLSHLYASEGMRMKPDEVVHAVEALEERLMRVRDDLRLLSAEIADQVVTTILAEVSFLIDHILKRLDAVRNIALTAEDIGLEEV